jgi:hypothetical protein
MRLTSLNLKLLYITFCWKKTQKLSGTTTYMDRIVKEAIEIQLHPRIFNREAGFGLNRTWKPIINTLRKLTQHNRADEQDRPMNNWNGSRSAQCHKANQLRHQSPDWLAPRSAPQPQLDIKTPGYKLMQRRGTARIHPPPGTAASPKCLHTFAHLEAATMPLWVQIPESLSTKLCPPIYKYG